MLLSIFITTFYLICGSVGSTPVAYHPTLVGAPSLPKTSEIIVEEPVTLLLHFDVNKTLIAEDPAGKQTLDNVLNDLLAQKYTYCWDENISEPISYMDYIEHYVVVDPDPDNSSGDILRAFKAKRRSFTNKFVQYLQNTNHPLKEEITKEYATLIEKMKGEYVFPSFFRLVEELEDKNINYHVFLRTFGKDIDPVVKSIEEKFPRIHFSSRGKFNEQTCVLDNQPIHSPKDLYEKLKSASGHIAFQDDWKYWNSHGETKEFGKLFPVNLDDQTTISIFFDDNVKEDPSRKKGIVAPFDANSNVALPEDILREKNLIVRIDTLDAIIDDNYFKNQVLKTLKANGKQKEFDLLNAN